MAERACPICRAFLDLHVRLTQAMSRVARVYPHPTLPGVSWIEWTHG